MGMLGKDVLDVNSIMDVHRGYWSVVEECKRVLHHMNQHVSSMPRFLDKPSVCVLRNGLVNPSNRWRLVVDDNGEVANPSDPIMEVSAWDGLESDANCNCSMRFPAKWLYMADEELVKLFRRKD